VEEDNPAPRQRDPDHYGRYPLRWWVVRQYQQYGGAWSHEETIQLCCLSQGAPSSFLSDECITVAPISRPAMNGDPISQI
jgi:hypothetical protein